MSKSNVIFHIDGDSFFVSCEIALRPELKNKDVLVSYNKSTSIITALSYSLKQKGIKVPMKVSEAKKITKDFINLEPNFELYEKMSKRIYEYLTKNITKKVEIGSIDEWYIDVSLLSNLYRSPIELAKKIQNDILNKIGISVSIGISYNKWLAKMATDLNKPFGITLITKQDIKNILWPRKIESYIGIGKETYEQLKKINVNTIGDLANVDKKQLIPIFKNKVNYYINNIYGIGDYKIDTNKNVSKSIGVQKSFDKKHICELSEIYRILYEISSELNVELKKRNEEANRITILIKKGKTNFYSTSMFLFNPLIEINDIYNSALRLFYKIWDEEEISTIGISLSSLKNKYVSNKNLGLFELLPKESDVIKIINNVNNKIKSKNLKLLSNKEV